MMGTLEAIIRDLLSSSEKVLRNEEQVCMYKHAFIFYIGAQLFFVFIVWLTNIFFPGSRYVDCWPQYLGRCRLLETFLLSN